MAQKSGIRWVLAPVILGCVALVGAGCSSGADSAGADEVVTAETAGADSELAAATACADPGAPVVELTALSGKEPKISIPLPEGWEQNETMNSDTIRGAIVAPALTENGFAPNVTVEVADLTGQVASAADVVKSVGEVLVAGGNVVNSQADGEMCGSPAVLAQVTLAPAGVVPARPGTVMVVGYESGDSVMAVTVIGQTLNGDNPDYVEAVQIVFDGTQIVPQ